MHLHLRELAAEHVIAGFTRNLISYNKKASLYCAGAESYFLNFNRPLA